MFMGENICDIQRNKLARILEPIIDENIENILSLEEVCQPLHDFVENLPTAIQDSFDLAKQRMRDELSIDEAASICLFQSLSNFSIVCNQILENPDRHLIKPWLPYLKLFLTALSKLPNFNGTIWYYQQLDLHDRYKDNEKRVWWAAIVCTVSLTSLNSESDTYSTIFSIETSQGKDITNYSYHQNTKNILLLPGTCFQVVGHLVYKNGFNIIHLKEYKPSYPLIQLSYSIKRTCSICLQIQNLQSAYRIETPIDTCSHTGKIRRICDNCLYEYVINLLHISILNPIICPEMNCSNRSFLSEEHIRLILLYGNTEFLWNSRRNTQRQLRNNSSERWIKENALPCPKCRSPIEKNGGCDKVKCSKCSHIFYWSLVTRK